MDEPDLTVTLRAAQSGDEGAIARLFRVLQPALLRYLGHRAPGAAEDLASETWLAFSRVLAEFDGDAQDLRAWLFGVARRQVANFWRTAGRHPTVPDGNGAEPAPAPDTGELAIAALSSQDAVRALVRDLPDDQAEIVLLRVVGGLTAERVGALLGMKPGAVRVAQHRALRRLADVWSPGAVTR